MQCKKGNDEIILFKHNLVLVTFGKSPKEEHPQQQLSKVSRIGADFLFCVAKAFGDASEAKKEVRTFLFLRKREKMKYIYIYSNRCKTGIKDSIKTIYKTPSNKVKKVTKLLHQLPKI